MTKLHTNLALIDQRRADWADSSTLSDVTTEALLDMLEERYLDDEDIRRMLVMIGEAL